MWSPDFWNETLWQVKARSIYSEIRKKKIIFYKFGEQIPEQFCRSQDHNCCLHPQVVSNGRPCILFQARKLSLRYERQKQLDLTERAFSPQKAVDISKSVCSQDKATYVSKRNKVIWCYTLYARNIEAFSLFFKLSFCLSVRLSPQGWSWGLEMWTIWEVSPSGMLSHLSSIFVVIG